MPIYAAIDLGSNSVRMMTAQVLPDGSTKVLAADRQVTRLGASVFETGKISEEAMQTACSTLQRMGEMYRRFDVDGIRAVATSATRDASNQQQFLSAAAAALGAPLEVISGQEEARLIQLGVQARWPQPRQCILIVDVGGGSAEVIVADRGSLAEAYSKPIGAVRLQQVFLRSDPPLQLELRQLEEFIDEKLSLALPTLQRYRIDRVIATSATAAAVVCAINKIPRAQRDSADQAMATVSQLREFYDHASRLKLSARRELIGIGPRRAEIIIPGAAVLLRVLETLELPALYYSTGGLRDGIIADLAIRTAERDSVTLDAAQRRTVETFAKRYEVPMNHARHVAYLSVELFRQLKSLHGLTPEDGKLLEAAAYLLDIGHFVSDSAHHKHSHYLIANSDLAGFTADERQMIALLCRYHRKSMPQSRHEPYQKLSSAQRQRLLRLIPLLRAADALDQSQEQVISGIRARVRSGAIQLKLESPRLAELEEWALLRTSSAFEQVFGERLEVVREG